LDPPLEHKMLIVGSSWVHVYIFISVQVSTHTGRQGDVQELQRGQEPTPEC